MKFLVASDLHGSAAATARLLEAAERRACDRIVLLGDLYYHGPRNPLPDGYDPSAVARMLNAKKEMLLAVRGNCDADVDCTISEFALRDSLDIVLGDTLALCTHGDRYNGDDLPPFGGYDVLLHGHTHLSGIRVADGVTVVNPGSASLPKGGTPACYAILTDGNVALYALHDDAPVAEARFGRKA